MIKYFVATLLLCSSAHAAELTVSPAPNGRTYLAATFPDADPNAYVGFVRIGTGESFFTRTHTASVCTGNDCRADYAGFKFKLPTAAVVAMTSFELKPGDRVEIHYGLDGGLPTEIVATDVFVAAGPAPVPAPEPQPQPVPPAKRAPIVGAPVVPIPLDIPVGVTSPAPQPQPIPQPVATNDPTCDGISKSFPNVIFCESFEKLTDLASWRARFGDPFDGCLGDSCIANVVPNGFRGSRSLAQQFQPGREGGTTGLFRFADQPLRRVAITMARKYSSNFKDRDHGVKDNRFEEDGGNFEIFGESSTGIGKGKGTPTSGNRFPFGAPLDIEPNSCIQFTNGVFGAPVCTVNTTANVGYAGENDVHYDLIPGNGYDFQKDMKPGQWVCIQAAFDNWGKSNMTARYWVGGKKVIDVAGIDGTKLRASLANGVTTYDFVAFYNNGYEGSSVAQRLDDNIVITTDSEPVPCSAIGFDGTAQTEPVVAPVSAEIVKPAPVLATPLTTPVTQIVPALFQSGFELADTAFTGTRGAASIETVNCKSGRCARLDMDALTNDQTAFYYRSLENQLYDSLYVGADFMFPKGFSFEPVPASDGHVQSNDLKALIFEVLPDSAGRGHRLFLNFKGRTDPSHGQLAAFASQSEDRWAFASQDIVADGTWHRVEFEAVRKPNGVPGRFRAWLDGQMVIDNAYKLCLAECAPVSELKVGAYVNYATSQAQHWYVDNVVFGRSRAETVH
jgi:hypothetical protein